MPRFPTASYREAVRAAKKLGFSFYRMAKGNHEIWCRSSDARAAIIPHHKNIKRKTLKNILDAFQISPSEFSRLKRGGRLKSEF